MLQRVVISTIEHKLAGCVRDLLLKIEATAPIKMNNRLADTR